MRLLFVAKVFVVFFLSPSAFAQFTGWYRFLEQIQGKKDTSKKNEKILSEELSGPDRPEGMADLGSQKNQTKDQNRALASEDFAINLNSREHEEFSHDSGLEASGQLGEPSQTEEVQKTSLTRSGPKSLEDSPFLQRIRELRGQVRYSEKGRSMTEGPRKLIPMPLHEESNYFGLCGSRHYNPEPRQGSITDAWADPLTACAFAALLQKWKEDFCPDPRAGCVASWGDISDNSRKHWDGHQTHTHGQCIDFRPFQKENYVDAPLTFHSANYDRETTQKFLKLAREMGAEPIYFNDPKILKSDKSVQYSRGHNNHIHLCFLGTIKVTQTCDNYRPDLDTCPELLNSLHEGTVREVASKKNHSRVKKKRKKSLSD